MLLSRSGFVTFNPLQKSPFSPPQPSPPLPNPPPPHQLTLHSYYLKYLSGLNASKWSSVVYSTNEEKKVILKGQYQLFLLFVYIEIIQVMFFYSC